MEKKRIHWYVVGMLAFATLFAEVWGLMFGRLRVGGWTGLGIGLLCLLMGFMALAAGDGISAKR